MLWLAIGLILYGWILLRKAKKLEAAHRVPECPNQDQSERSDGRRNLSGGVSTLRSPRDLRS